VFGGKITETYVAMDSVMRLCSSCGVACSVVFDIPLPIASRVAFKLGQGFTY